MGILITLRDDASISYFKEIMIGVIKKYPDGFERIVISSGFFNKESLVQKNKFRRTLIEAVNDNGNIKEIDLLGVYTDCRKRGVLAKYITDKNYVEYTKFIGSLKKGITTSTTIKPYYYVQGNWHAKICFFIPKGQKEWALAIVGSSNMTRPAFWSIGSGTTYPYNLESDVTVWKDSDHKMNDIINAFDDKSGILFHSDESVDTAKVDKIVSDILRLIDSEEVTLLGE